MNSKAIFNRAPLPKGKYAPLPLTAVKPQGWLLKQLQAQAEGLSGHLYEFWPDVSDKTAWLGGDGDAWERAPYYLDGLLPLAYLTGDERLLERVKRHVEWILDSQREDGQFGPESNDDWWPRMVALKALIQYYTATTDERIPRFMLKYFKYQYQNIDARPLQDWAVARGGENILCAIWLYNLTGAQFLLRLCDKLDAQTLDWSKFFDRFPITRSMSVHRPWKELVETMREEPMLTGRDRPFSRELYHQSHVVNVAMALKTPALRFLRHGGEKDRTAFYVGWEKLMKHHGVANGMFTGDEHLSGNRPTQGTELCAVVEAMYSLETLACALGDLAVGDALEKIAFNALPATVSRDMNSHQYLQQANQVRCSDEARNWYNNSSESNIFGLEPNFGCCTANMHQGWPKYASSLWLASIDGGLAALSYAPCIVRFIAGGQPVKLRVETEYPFEQSVKIYVEPKGNCSFPVYLRVPKWCDDFRATCDGNDAVIKDGTAVLKREWHSGDVIEISLPMKPVASKWYHQSEAVEYGPLTMALPIEEDWRIRTDRGAYSDYEVWPKGEWNYALAANQDLGSRAAVRTAAEAGFIGDSPLEMEVTAVQLPDWGMNGANCSDPPIGERRAKDEAVEIRLTPYGSSRLHIAQFPVAELD